MKIAVKGACKDYSYTRVKTHLRELIRGEYEPHPHSTKGILTCPCTD